MLAPVSSRPSPLPNRVTPFGAVVADPARGAWMGNRGGKIHEGFRIVRPQASRRWIVCRLVWKDWRRTPMGPGYTELFFHDEATALAAGHRPCFLCRREAALAFAAAFGEARADAIDARLAAERRSPKPVVTQADLAPGAMAEAGGAAFLWDGAALRRWSFAGYGPPERPQGPLRLLTPPSTLAALRAGYRPAPGAGAWVER